MRLTVLLMLAACAAARPIQESEGRSLLQINPPAVNPAFCKLAGDGLAPRVEEPDCPMGFEDTGDKCLTKCSSLNTFGSPVKYETRDLNCVPTCGGKGGFVVNSTADGNVTCGACPASAPRYLSAYSACYASCPSMYPSLYINTQPSPLCAAKCPSLYPIARNATHCANSRGVLVKRNTVVPATAAMTNQTASPVVRESVEPKCPADTTQLEGDASCYKCYGSATVVVDPTTQQPICQATCPDTHTKAGSYCWDEAAYPDLASWKEEQLVALLGEFGCVTKCVVSVTV